MTEKEKALTDICNTARSRYPDNLLYIMPVELSKKLKSFMLIREDLIFVLDIAKQLISLKESVDTNSTIELALWQSILITYGKCFTENKAGFSKFEKSQLEQHDKKYQLLHEHLMELRHSYIAHRDDTVNEQALVFIKISKTGFMLDGDTEDVIISRKLASPRVTDLKFLIELLELLITEATIKIQKNGDKAHNAFLRKYTPERARSFLVNNMKFEQS
ncbi:hypothetical protein [Sphingobacterium hungaricum]|uniref:Uncharacterized protein n=1 Tax=Sphingobacterium hungaricum TaxID=2082723 RepID=A0A928YRA7_9SPHI|nr:hypothetical protein [Sphingobacterium hungaricum]MBE8714794.1 hypothetical protein [Sphingobacterium hungaricum]